MSSVFFQNLFIICLKGAWAMAEFAIERLRKAVKNYIDETGISLGTLAYALENVSEQALRNALNGNDKGSPKSIEMLSKLIDLYPIKINDD